MYVKESVSLADAKESQILVQIRQGFLILQLLYNITNYNISPLLAAPRSTVPEKSMDCSR